MNDDVRKEPKVFSINEEITSHQVDRPSYRQLKRFRAFPLMENALNHKIRFNN